MARVSSALILGVWLMAVGVTQPTGAGGTVHIYDNASAANGTNYTFAEISAAFPTALVDLGTTPKSYLGACTVQVGDVGSGTAATTLQDSDVSVFFNTAKVLQYRTTQTTSWSTYFGTKVGTGNKASGRNGCLIYQGGASTFRGKVGFYGSEIYTQGAGLNFTPATSGTDFELINCIVGNKGTGTTSTIALGSASVALSNIYNVDFWGNISSGTLGLITGINSSIAERISVAINAAACFIRSGQSSLSVKDMVFFGTPSVADISCTSGSAITWALVNIGWSGNAPKFGTMTQSAGNITEYRTGDVKTADPTGLPVSSISAKLTDAIASVAFDTVTSAAGRIDFGSGILTNAIPVMDHYGSSSYLTRDRGPYFMELNTTNPNPTYAGKSYYFSYPTDASGGFSNMADVIPMDLATPALAITVNTLVSASSEDMIVCPVPART